MEQYRPEIDEGLKLIREKEKERSKRMLGLSGDNKEKASNGEVREEKLTNGHFKMNCDGQDEDNTDADGGAKT